jgi:hypothetical protein
MKSSGTKKLNGCLLGTHESWNFGLKALHEEYQEWDHNRNVLGNSQNRVILRVASFLTLLFFCINGTVHIYFLEAGRRL